MRWAVTYNDPLAARWSGTPLGVPLHPVQAYSALVFLTLSIFLLVWLPAQQAAGRCGGSLAVGSRSGHFRYRVVARHRRARFAIWRCAGWAAGGGHSVCACRGAGDAWNAKDREQEARRNMVEAEDAKYGTRSKFPRRQPDSGWTSFLRRNWKA